MIKQVLGIPAANKDIYYRLASEQRDFGGDVISNCTVQRGIVCRCRGDFHGNTKMFMGRSRKKRSVKVLKARTWHGKQWKTLGEDSVAAKLGGSW